MKYRYLVKRFSSHIQIIGFSIISLSALGLWVSLKNYESYQLDYRQAESVAARLYGDRDGELDPFERREWYKDMHLNFGEEPRQEHLTKFIDSQNMLEQDLED